MTPTTESQTRLPLIGGCAAWVTAHSRQTPVSSLRVTVNRAALAMAAEYE